MTDLTEKWKAGELGHGAYYVRIEGVFLIDFFDAIKLKFVRFKKSAIDEVLAPVPSYEELQSLEADRLAKNEGEEIVAELKQKINILTESQMKLENTIGELKEENARLKELLKECLPIVSAEVMTWQIRGGEESHQRGKELLTKIEEVLK